MKYGTAKRQRENTEDVYVNRALDPLTPGFMLNPEENLTRFIITGEDAYDD